MANDRRSQQTHSFCRAVTISEWGGEVAAGRASDWQKILLVQLSVSILSLVEPDPRPYSAQKVGCSDQCSSY